MLNGLMKHYKNKRSYFMNTKVVYSAIMDTGHYTLNEPTVDNPDWDLICFTTNKSLKSKKWRIIQVRKPPNISQVKLARRYKMLAHNYLSNYDVSLWLDAKFTINQDLNKFADNNLKNFDIAIMNHNKRNNIFDEAETLKAKNFKDNFDVIKEIDEQINRYKLEGYPSNRKLLLSSGILLRKHNSPQVIRVMELWWKEILKSSQRDMLSLPYVLWILKNKNVAISLNILDFKKTYESFMNRKK